MKFVNFFKKIDLAFSICRQEIPCSFSINSLSKPGQEICTDFLFNHLPHLPLGGHKSLLSFIAKLFHFYFVEMKLVQPKRF